MAASDYFDKDCNTTPLSGLELQSIITPDECGWLLWTGSAHACELAGYPGRCQGGSRRPWWHAAGQALACELAGYPRRCLGSPQSLWCRTAGPVRACELAGYAGRCRGSLYSPWCLHSTRVAAGAACGGRDGAWQGPSMMLTLTPPAPMRAVMRLRACCCGRALCTGTQRAADARARRGNGSAVLDSAGSGGSRTQARPMLIVQPVQ